MKKKIIKNLIATLFLFVVIAPRAQAVTLSFHPSTQQVMMGSSVDVSLVISGLGNGTAPSVSTFDLDVRFDPAILGFGSAVFGDPALGDQLDIFGLGGNPISSEIIVGLNLTRLNLLELSLDSPSDLDAKQAPSFTLATLTFDALKVGSSPLEIFSATSLSLGDATGELLDSKLFNGNVTVVPIPGAIWLMGSALVGILGLARQNN